MKMFSKKLFSSLSLSLLSCYQVVVHPAEQPAEQPAETQSSGPQLAEPQQPPA